MGYFSKGGGALSSSALRLLWEWNRADLTQFDTAALLDFTQTTGLGPTATSVVPSFVANAFQGVPGIRLTGTDILGGYVLPVKASELLLPARYILEARIIEIDTANIVAAICPFGVLDATTGSGSGWKGTVFRRQGGGTVASHRLTTFGAVQTEQVLRSSVFAAADPTAGTFDAVQTARGGETYRMECFRQAGATPNAWSWRTVLDDPANFDSGGLAPSGVTGAGVTSPDWDGEDMDRFGLGIINDQGAILTGAVTYLDLRVFAHPLDR